MAGFVRGWEAAKRGLTTLHKPPTNETQQANAPPPKQVDYERGMAVEA